MKHEYSLHVSRYNPIIDRSQKTIVSRCFFIIEWWLNRAETPFKIQFLSFFWGTGDGHLVRRVVDENYIDSYKIILELLKSGFNDYRKSRGACPHVPNSQKIHEVPEDSSILRMSLRYDGELPNRCGGGTCGNCVFKL